MLHVLSRRSVQVLLIGLTASALYIPTLAPTVLWNGGDFAEFQTRAARLEIVPTVWGHPLWVILVHPFTRLPVGDVAYRANLATALIAALALALAYLVMRELGASAWGSALGAAALAVSHTFWTYAVMPKSYSLNILILMGAILLLTTDDGQRTTARYWGRSIFLSGLLLGLGLLSHPLLLTALPGALVYLWLKKPKGGRGRALAGFLGGFVPGLAPFLALTIGGGATQSTATVGANFISQFIRLLLTPSLWPTALWTFAACLAYQFLFTLLPGILGLRELWRHNREALVLLGLIYLGDVAFVWAWLPITPHLNEYIQNLHFYLPSYVLFALWAAFGFDALLAQVRQHAHRGAVLRWGLAALTLLSPILTYAIAPQVARPYLAQLGQRELPGRDTATYLFSPWKHTETGARRLGEAILAHLPADAAIFADWSLYGILRYLQEVEGQRPDVQLSLLPFNGQQLEPIRAAAASRPVYIPDVNRYYDMESLSAYFDIVPEGLIYHLIPRRMGGCTP